MPRPPVRKSFIAKGLTGGMLVLVKYLAQIGNRREKLGKRNKAISQYKNPQLARPGGGAAVHELLSATRRHQGESIRKLVLLEERSGSVVALHRELRACSAAARRYRPFSLVLGAAGQWRCPCQYQSAANSRR